MGAKVVGAVEPLNGGGSGAATLEGDEKEEVAELVVLGLKFDVPEFVVLALGAVVLDLKLGVGAVVLGRKVEGAEVVVLGLKLDDELELPLE